jgi:hypothetical protein
MSLLDVFARTGLSARLSVSCALPTPFEPQSPLARQILEPVRVRHSGRGADLLAHRVSEADEAPRPLVSAGSYPPTPRNPRIAASTMSA